MASNITLTSSMRSNLSSLKSLACQMSTTQTRLSTGKRVNSAIDNASSYYQARALSNRSSDLDMLLDAMGQSIQTITASVQGIESGLHMFEQVNSIAEQALSSLPDNMRFYNGPTVAINSSMTTAEIQNIINSNMAVELEEDITLSSTLNIDNDITIIGNGHSITYAGTIGFKGAIGNTVVNDPGECVFNISGDAKISNLVINYSNSAAQAVAIAIDGGRAEIDNLTINATTSANRLYGIQVLNDGKLQLDTTKNINLSGDYSENLVNGNPDLWSGRYNTDMLTNVLGANGLATSACNNYATEGLAAGSWYLPALGELCDLYGTDYTLVTAFPFDSGTVGNVKAKVNESLGVLREKGLTVDDLINNYYWSSSPEDTRMWTILFSNGSGGRTDLFRRDAPRITRAIAEVDITSKANIGDIMYSDFSTSAADNYDADKTAIGIVFAVSADKSKAKIVASQNFEAMYFATNDRTTSAIQGYFWNGNNPSIPYGLKALTAQGDINVSNETVGILTTDSKKYVEQFNTILNAYDYMVDDSSYQGINLLKGGHMDVMFNETRTNSLRVQGNDISSQTIGIITRDWHSKDDIATSINEVKNAMNSLRNITEALGNSLSIIQTRMNFTDALTDILQTGADDLILADMNEESANYLALQTRNNLAVNALSLAAQSNNSVLKLF